MKSATYFDPEGNKHTIDVRFLYSKFEILLDGEHYTNVDDRQDLEEAIRELVAYRRFTHDSPKKKRQKKTSRKSLAANEG